MHPVAATGARAFAFTVARAQHLAIGDPDN
jgi:hypothetical protein